LNFAKRLNLVLHDPGLDRSNAFHESHPSSRLMNNSFSAQSIFVVAPCRISLRCGKHGIEHFCAPLL
jgi:hypothetical protein